MLRPEDSVPPAVASELVRVEPDEVQGLGAGLEQTPSTLQVSALVVVHVLVLVHLDIYEPVVERKDKVDPGVVALCPIEPDRDFTPKL